jgi:predicted DNA-binding transcriptional regulator YafY
MANTSSRTLRLLSLLQTHRYWPGPELADRLEVSVRTLRRDVDRLRELGYPVRAQRGVDGGYQLDAGAALPPLVLDDDEAVALTVALLNSTRATADTVAEASVRALAKVVQVMPKRLRRRVDAVRAVTDLTTFGGTGPSVAPEVLTTVAQACRDNERLDFDYVAADGAGSRRHCEPMRLVWLGRRWYLVAYDLVRHDWRSFRLDRVSAPRGTGARFAPRRLPAKDAATFVRARFADLPAARPIVVTVAAPAELVGVRIGTWAAVEPIDDDRCRVRMRSDAFEWAVLALVTADADFTVDEPAEFAAFVGDWGARLTRARRRSPSAG